MSDLTGPHGYLTCEDIQHVYEKQRRALGKIVEKGCHHCSSWELACSATGQTYYAPVHVPDAEERVVKRQREDILKLRDALKTYDIAYGEDVGVLRDFHTETDKAMAETEHYEKYRTSHEAQSHDD